MTRLGLLICLTIALAGCNLDMNIAVATPITDEPTRIPTSIPTQTPQNDDDGWDEIMPGMAQRRTSIPQTLAFLEAVRIDPTQYQFRVHYQPRQPLTLQQWRERLPAALLIVNTNFFSQDYTALGLLVSDGVLYSGSYVGRGGTFAVENGVPRVFSTMREPYRGQAFEQAVQAFPMLVLDGEQAYFDRNQRETAPRSAIGQDEQGNIIVMVTRGLGVSLEGLSTYLSSADLGLRQAFNLDGGGSTMLYLAATGLSVPSFDAVPAVLAIYPR